MMIRIKIRILILIVVMGWGVGEAWANPFRSAYVCLPDINPNRTYLEFEIREGLHCQEGEQLAKVVTAKDGTIFLYPTNPPLEAEVKKDFDEYKRYYGVE